MAPEILPLGLDRLQGARSEAAGQVERVLRDTLARWEAIESR